MIEVENMQNTCAGLPAAGSTQKIAEHELTAQLEEKIIQHCTPTLLGLKQANMFTFQYRSDHRKIQALHAAPLNYETIKAIDACKQKLHALDIDMLVLAHNRCGELLYVFNRSALAKLIGQPEITEYLQEIGYNTSSVEDSLQLLSTRIKAYRTSVDECGFPHEVGLFLGYPLSDVISFIEQKGQGALCCGCWKVYSNADAAQKYFRVLKRSTEFCKSKLGCGYRFEEIISMGTSQNFALELAS